MKPLEIVGVSYSYGPRTVLQEVTFSLKDGELVGLIGPNGAGKTTLLRLILGLARPSSGEIRLWDRNPYKDPVVRQRIGYLPQRAVYNTHFPLTAGEAVFLALPRRPFALGPNSAERAKIKEALALVGMEKYLDTPLSALSGGQQQLVFLARCLVHKPSLLLLDEPTNALDLFAQHRFYNLLAELQQKIKLTVLVVSHDILALAQVAERFLLLDKKIIASGPPSEILYQFINTPLAGACLVQAHGVG